MAIETDFRFNQIREPAAASRLNLQNVDLLGPLRSFIGSNHIRRWSGPGFNLIWRPHDKSGDNPQDFFLELNVTKEDISFTDITDVDGIANRGLRQPTIALGGLAYTQAVTDVTVIPNKKLHFEPGVWLNVPLTSDPNEPDTVARLGSIPHGTTIHAQGTSFPSPDNRPRFDPVSIMPFAIGSPDDGVTGIVQFPEGAPPLATNLTSRTPVAGLVGLTDVHFADLSKILSDVTDSQKLRSTQVYVITTEVAEPDRPQAHNSGHPKEGGGTDNIAFLTGAAGGPNAVAARMTAIFWLEEVIDDNGGITLQMQYVQRVLLNFNGLSWPHVSLATLVVVDEEKN